MPCPPSAVLFDIDGTLTDTNYLHTLAWRRAFLDAGLDVPSSRIHRMIGAAGDVLLRELAGEERDDIKHAWRRHFAELRPEIRALPGAADLLRAVAAAGPKVVLATSSEEDDVVALRAALGADEVIDAATTAGDVDEAKPSPEVFERALESVGVTATDAVVVGDTGWDVQAAARAGLQTVAVTTGGVSRAELEAAGAVAVYDGPADLLAHLDASPLARLWF